MKLKWIVSTTAIILLIIVAFLGLAKHDSVMAAQDEGTKIEGSLIDRFATDGSADFIVRFNDQADLSAAYTMDWDAEENLYVLRSCSHQPGECHGMLNTDG
jgi:hypothetical protein